VSQECLRSRRHSFSVSILPSAKGFGSKLNSQISGDVNRSGKSSGLSFGKLFAKAGAAAAALGVGAFFKDTISAASDAQQAVGGVEAVFGKYAKGVLKDSKKAAQGLGLSAAAYNELITVSGAMLKNKGIEDFAKQSSDLVKIGADLSAQFGGSTKDAVAALNAAMRGESDPIERYGISLGEAAIKAELFARNQGALTGAALEQAKTQIRLDLVTRQSADAMGAFGRESNTLAGQQARLGAQFENIKASLGSRLLPVLTQVASYVNSTMLPAITAFTQGFRNGTGAGGQLADALSRARAVTLTFVAATAPIAKFILRNKTAVATFVGVIGTAIVVTKAWRGAQLALNFVLTANPIGIVVVAIAALAAGLVIAYKRSETFRNIVDGAFSAVKAGAQTLANFVTRTIPAAFNTVVSFVRSIPSRIAAIFTGAASVFYNAGVQLMAQLAAGITASIGKAIQAAQDGLSRLKGLLPGSPIKWGPLKNWNNGGAGKRLMDLVTLGITKATPKTVKAAKTAFEKVGDALRTERDNLRSTLDGLKSDFTSLADSVSSAFLGDLFNPPEGTSFIDNLLSKKSQLTGLLSSFTTLKGWGLDPAFLSQLFASGNGALITELAGMGQAGAMGASSLFGEVQSLSTQLGNSVASNDPVARGIADVTEELRIANKQLSFLADDIGKQLNGAASKAQRDKKGRGKK
jgi:hypothetical protein